MNIKRAGCVLAFLLCYMVDKGAAQQLDDAEVEDMRFRFDGALAVDLSRVNQSEHLPWANGRFVYEFSPEVQRHVEKTEAFENACKQLVAHTALKCVNRLQVDGFSDRDYVYVVERGSNYSYIGRRGGKQLLSILNWNNPFKISHEIKHALGWGHEQQQPKRDQYVDILFANIPDDYQEHFYITDYGNEGEYDFDSVMHYYPTDFALPAQKSIQAKARFQSHQSMMGQRNHLSEIDLLEIQEFYGDPTVEWCGISRKPEFKPISGCSYECRLESDPTIGNWVLVDACDLEKEILSFVN